MNITDFYTTNEDGDEVLISKGETKSMADVIQCIAHNKGTDSNPVKLFIAMYHEYKKWEWFDKYQEYLAEKKKIEDYNSTLVPDEDGVTPDPAVLPTVPSDFVQETDDIVIQAAVTEIMTQYHTAMWISTLESNP